MTLRANATLTFTSYEVTNEGIDFHFVSPDPGPGEPSDYFVLITDAELATVTTQLQLRTLVRDRLERKLRATGIASKLDQFIGQSLVIA